MRKTIILAPQYYPETGAASRRITAVAEYLAEKNWDVTVITEAPHYPQNRIFDGYGLRDPDVRTENGVEVVRLRPWIVSRTSLLKRLLSETRFCLLTIPLVFRREADLILASSPYMFLAQIGLLLARIKKAKFVWDVRDLTWLYPKSTGKNTFGLDWLVEQLMIWSARKADGLTTATEGLLGYFPRKPKAAMVLHNGVSDKWLDELLELEPPVRSNPPMVVYAGLLGYNHALETLIDAAQLVPTADFTIAGDGPERSSLEQRVTDLGLKNVRFTGYLKQGELLSLYNQAQVLVSHVRANPLYRWTQPAKLWEYMATGRPVVHAGEGEVIAILEEKRLAVTCSPKQPQDLAKAIKDVLANPQESYSMAQRARGFVDQERRRSKLLERLAVLMDGIVNPQH